MHVYAAPPTPAPAAPMAVTLPDFAALVEKIGPAVVNIRSTEQVRVEVGQGLPPEINRDELSELFQRFLGFSFVSGKPQRYMVSPNTRSIERNNGLGSGFIISADGYILTNAHVLDDADNIYVRLVDKREFKAKLVGTDLRTDIALLKIDANNLPVVGIGDSNKIKVGEWVLAIGALFCFDNTVTVGVVSAKGRDAANEYLPFIQTDVVINPGNSGGPLINMHGEVVGMNSQIYSRTGGFIGISFAIPINEAMRIAWQLKTTGRVVRGRLGVVVSPVAQDIADLLGLPRASGVLVSNIAVVSPAAYADIENGDIILKFDGKPVANPDDLSRWVAETKPGTRAIVSLWRKGKVHQVRIMIAQELPPKSVPLAQNESLASKTLAKNPLGLVVNDISPNKLKAFKMKGVLIEAVEGPAVRAGLQRGDLLLRVGDTDVSNVVEFEQKMRTLNLSKKIALLMLRDGIAQFIAVQPGESALLPQP